MKIVTDKKLREIEDYWKQYYEDKFIEKSAYLGFEIQKLNKKIERLKAFNMLRMRQLKDLK